MKRGFRAVSRSAAVALIALSVAAAVRPSVFAQTSGGLWEVSRSDGGRRNICLPDPVLLTQYEHLRSKCSRDIIRDQSGRAEISYSCGGGAFGQSKIEQLTPRSLRIETQGISGDSPFHYILQARRLGDC